VVVEMLTVEFCDDELVVESDNVEMEVLRVEKTLSLRS